MLGTTQSQQSKLLDDVRKAPSPGLLQSYVTVKGVSLMVHTIRAGLYACFREMIFTGPPVQGFESH